MQETVFSVLAEEPLTSTKDTKIVCGFNYFIQRPLFTAVLNWRNEEMTDKDKDAIIGLMTDFYFHDGCCFFKL